MSTVEKMRRLIENLGTAPDSHLHQSLSAECRTFRGVTLEESTRFIRNLRDMSVNIGGASSFVMQLFELVLADQESESEEDQQQRREELRRTRSCA